MKKKDIFKHQNTKEMLNILYAQRFYYNKANLLDQCLLILTIIICVCNFASINDPFFQIVVNIILVIICYWISKKIEKNTIKGAHLKKYFDYTLFGFKLSHDFKKQCLELTYKVIKKPRKDYEQQIFNDGKANPPGLKDWYYNEQNINDIDTIKSIQKQNLCWDQILAKQYLIFLLVVSLVLIIIYIVVCYILDFNIINIIAGIIPFISLIRYLLDKINAYRKINKYIKELNIKMNYVKTKNDLLEIQKKIDLRRKQNFLPPNFFHKLKSKSIHEQIEFISRNKNI